jgi:hypothetical protein
LASPYDLPLTVYNPGAFIRTALDLHALASRPEVAEQWNNPGALERMTVGGVAAHGLGIVEDILNHCERPEPATPRFLGIVEYYRAARLDKREDLDLEGHAFIIDLAERKAADGPGPVLEKAAHTIEQLKWMLPAMDPNKHVYLPRQPPMAGPLAMMVTNRTVELTAHMDDLAVSVGLPTPPITPEAGAMALTVLLSIARKMNTDLEVIRAMARVERAKPDAARAI